MGMHVFSRSTVYGDEAKMDTEGVENLINFNINVHDFWNGAFCPLGPI